MRKKLYENNCQTKKSVLPKEEEEEGRKKCEEMESIRRKESK
jgi:hypothetical protein